MKYLKAVIIIGIFLIVSCGGRNKDREENLYRSQNLSGVEIDNGRNRSSERDSYEVNPEPEPQQKMIKERETLKSISDLFYELEKAVFIVYGDLPGEMMSQGSGFFIAPNIGVTNYHVLEDAQAASIQIGNRRYDIAKILQFSPSDENDYIIFQTQYSSPYILEVANQTPRVGEEIFAIGSPKNLSNSLTKGSVSGWRGNLIQIDATIDHGSSGGPLFNRQGKVVGITTSGMGTGAELNFAVDIQTVPYAEFIN